MRSGEVWYARVRFGRVRSGKVWYGFSEIISLI